ncbi:MULTISPECIES: hypothetical protein [unclassified Marinobacterium]|uniref:hypothetical protein n=1 Tax=unclassified Marinobacterium TaxID=2644139 RepID=UPI00156A3D58|nr:MULTISPECIES: hypothetical protein [unclassified Marinobacterium]NRP09705.1 hypothetical protein [Marinobacterium sp. xm-g-48]NRP28753.1 hypothetical protein [Marinobacterium sp. xm-d-420]NRP38939.1 hypothetical protein [Marinobacterium sp. xm-a-121]NRP47220.1 hypothetical protein [Marinobacterium sp. xm-d-543]NRP57741.1 hypothetical protein [Marinobacterium sp. xm-d-510]
MGKLNFFLQLIRQMDSAANDLGLGSLTDSDRIVLVKLWDALDQKSSQATLSHEKFEELTRKQEIEVSRSQFFKSLKKLEDIGLIKRIGGPRSATYQLIDDNS